MPVFNINSLNEYFLVQSLEMYQSMLQAVASAHGSAPDTEEIMAMKMSDFFKLYATNGIRFVYKKPPDASNSITAFSKSEAVPATRPAPRSVEDVENDYAESEQMASKLESDFTKRVCDEIEKECGGVTFVLPGGATSSGLADRLIVVKGLMALVEFKGPETPDRENQLLTAKRIVQRVPGVYFKARMGAGAGGQPLYRLSVAWIEAGETQLAWAYLLWDGSGRGLVGAMRAFQEVKPSV